MNKTFKHTLPSGVKSMLEICHVPAGIRLTLSDHTTISGWFDPKQGAEIALAILEAAGVEAKSHEAATVPYGTPAHLGMIASHLKAYAEAKSMNDAEAKAQAELEAEALELRNAFFAVERKNWDEVAGSGESKKDWLRAARKAREMRAEK